MPAAEDGRQADFSGDLALLAESAREAGQIAMRFFRNDPEVWMKGGSSPVSEADYAVDEFLRDALTAARPGYGWLSEETPDTAPRAQGPLFVVDPIDGTRGFLEGSSRWCVSVAVVEAGRPVAGVLECPARRESFSARLGGGAFKNGVRLQVRPPGPHPRVGGPRILIDAMPSDLAPSIERIAHVPSLAYRLAMIADGSLDASFVKPSSHDWDLAAADLILGEAGGSLLDASGRAPTYGGADTRHGPLVAGSGELLSRLAGVIAGHAG